MSVLDRRAMVERPGNDLSVRRQCAPSSYALGSLSEPVAGADDLAVMRRSMNWTRTSVLRLTANDLRTQQGRRGQS